MWGSACGQGAHGAGPSRASGHWWVALCSLERPVQLEKRPVSGALETWKGFLETCGELVQFSGVVLLELGDDFVDEQLQ